MAGTFGYELDVNRMTEEEKDEVRAQIRIFKKHYELIQYGEYYRLSSPAARSAAVWEMASPDGGEALVSAVYHHVRSNPMPVYVKLGGLREDCMYSLELTGVPEENITDCSSLWKWVTIVSGKRWKFPCRQESWWECSMMLF